MSANALGGHESPEVKAAKKGEKEILKDLKKDMKSLAKTLAKDEGKDLRKFFKYFKKLEKHNDEFIASYNEAVSRYSAFSSEAQKQILIDGFCTDSVELDICIPEITFEYSVGEAIYQSDVCVDFRGSSHSIFMVPEPEQLTFYVNGELKYVRQESRFMYYLLYTYNSYYDSSWYGFYGSGLDMEVGQTISKQYGDQYGHLTFVDATDDSIELRLDLRLQYTDHNSLIALFGRCSRLLMKPCHFRWHQVIENEGNPKSHFGISVVKKPMDGLFQHPVSGPILPPFAITIFRFQWLPILLTRA